jgi:hypothetical protein
MSETASESSSTSQLTTSQVDGIWEQFPSQQRIKCDSCITRFPAVVDITGTGEARICCSLVCLPVKHFECMSELVDLSSLVLQSVFSNKPHTDPVLWLNKYPKCRPCQMSAVFYEIMSKLKNTQEEESWTIGYSYFLGFHICVCF